MTNSPHGIHGGGRAVIARAQFETQPNALNALRLVLALTVIVWHSHALAGHTEVAAPLAQLLGYLPVDAFFAVSGFLICGAWVRSPDLGRYLWARARRILPGLWVCLLLTAFVIAPVATAAAGQTPLTAAGQWSFVVENAATWRVSTSIDSGPVGVPHTGDWNGSLWSLGYEAACYLAVAALGVAGLLRRRVLAGLTVTFWVLSAAMASAGVPALFGVLRVPRVGLMFGCGALLWAYRDRIPLDRRLAAASVGLVAVGSLTPDYRLLGAPAVAYLALFAGLRFGRHRRLALSNDVSYGTYVYAFPLQQALLLAGFTTAWLPFALASAAVTVPVAAASWFLVERPMLRLGRRQRSEQPVERGLPDSLVTRDDVVDGRSQPASRVHPLPDVEIA